jgi:hypothetical protein
MFFQWHFPKFQMYLRYSYLLYNFLNMVETNKALYLLIREHLSTHIELSPFVWHSQLIFFHCTVHNFCNAVFLSEMVEQGKEAQTEIEDDKASNWSSSSLSSASSMSSTSLKSPSLSNILV